MLQALKGELKDSKLNFILAIVLGSTSHNLTSDEVPSTLASLGDRGCANQLPLIVNWFSELMVVVLLVHSSYFSWEISILAAFCQVIATPFNCWYYSTAFEGP